METWDYLLANMAMFTVEHLPTRNTQCGSRSSVLVSNGFQQIETERIYFPKDLQSLLDSGHRPFCLKNILSTISILSLETRPIQQRNGCLSTISHGGISSLKGHRNSHILFHRMNFEESSRWKRHISFNKSDMTATTMLSKGTSDEHS